MMYVVFNPTSKIAYCRRVYPMTFEKLASTLRCRLYEYEQNIRDVGQDYKQIAYHGGLENIRIAIAEENEERPWPYIKFKSYKYDNDMNLWIDTHPRAKIYPIKTYEEYKNELKQI